MSEKHNTRPMHGGRGMRVAEKPKNFKSAIVKLFAFCKTYAPLVLIAVALDMVSVILRLIGPNKIKDITNAPVSYTHLDVYKRQNTPSRWPICPLSAKGANSSMPRSTLPTQVSSCSREK